MGNGYSRGQIKSEIILDKGTWKMDDTTGGIDRVNRVVYAKKSGFVGAYLVIVSLVREIDMNYKLINNTYRLVKNLVGIIL